MTAADDWTPTVTPETPPCRCSHHWVWHIDSAGHPRKCDIESCGCRSYRAPIPVRFRDRSEHDDSGPRLRYDHSEGDA